MELAKNDRIIFKFRPKEFIKQQEMPRYTHLMIFLCFLKPPPPILVNWYLRIAKKNNIHDRNEQTSYCNSKAKLLKEEQETNKTGLK